MQARWRGGGRGGVETASPHLAAVLGLDGPQPSPVVRLAAAVGRDAPRHLLHHGGRVRAAAEEALPFAAGLQEQNVLRVLRCVPR